MPWIYFMKSKSQVFPVFRICKARLQNIQVLKSDGTKEFNSRWKSWPFYIIIYTRKEKAKCGGIIYVEGIVLSPNNHLIETVYMLTYLKNRSPTNGGEAKTKWSLVCLKAFCEAFRSFLLYLLCSNPKS